MSRQQIVVDTNILVRRPSLFFEEEFKGVEFIIPSYVLGEIDKHKSREGDLGYGAREFGRTLNKIMDSSDGTFKEGFTLENDNVVKVFVPTLMQSLFIKLVSGGATYVDDLIVAMIKLYFKNAISLTADINMKAKCSSIGRKVIRSTKSTLNLLSDLYTGRTSIVIEDALDMAYLEKGGDIQSIVLGAFKEQLERSPYPNEYVTVKLNNGKNFLGRYDETKGKIVVIEKVYPMFGIKAKNLEQKMVFDALTNPDIKMVTITGAQGTGKTFLALASALEQVVEQGTYEKVLIGKNTAPLDKWSYQGFTSGDTKEKLLTHFGSYLTNLENLFSKGEDFEKDGRKMKTNDGLAQFELLNKASQLDVLDISSILGSSFKGRFIIIDEAQSFDMQAMRSIITRVGEGTKIVVIGDVLQSTQANLTGNKSGLYNTVDWLKEVDGVAHITLKTIERSSIVKKIAKVFDQKMFG